MKRIVANKAPLYNKQSVYTRNGQRFSVHISNEDDPFKLKIQMTELHPYDDADYVWAKYENWLVSFIQKGKVLDKMHWNSYEDEWYESVDEFVDEIVDTMAVELRNYNKDIEPRMMHN